MKADTPPGRQRGDRSADQRYANELTRFMLAVRVALAVLETPIDADEIVL